MPYPFYTTFFGPSAYKVILEMDLVQSSLKYYVSTGFVSLGPKWCYGQWHKVLDMFPTIQCLSLQL